MARPFGISTPPMLLCIIFSLPRLRPRDVTGAIEWMSEFAAAIADAMIAEKRKREEKK